MNKAGKTPSKRETLLGSARVLLPKNNTLSEQLE